MIQERIMKKDQIHLLLVNDLFIVHNQVHSSISFQLYCLFECCG